MLRAWVNGRILVNQVLREDFRRIVAGKVSNFKPVLHHKEDDHTRADC